MNRTSGVYPVYENQFKIGTEGRSSAAEAMKTIADMESFSVSIDGTTEEWTPMEAEGWVRRLMTGKGLSISLNGKRNVGDAGNDYVAGLMMAIGDAANSVLDWTFADGTVVHIPCVINVTNCGSGDSTNVGPLEFECLSDGKPTITPPAA